MQPDSVQLIDEAMSRDRMMGMVCTYRLAEIQYGRFERILFLPSPIDPDKVSAAAKDGLLEIRLAKRPMDQTYKVPISSE
jgi:HSP20 family protein